MVTELVTSVQHLIERGNFEEAHDLIKKNGEEDHKTAIELSIFKVRILRNIGEFEKASLLIEELNEKRNEIKNTRIKLLIIIEYAYLNWNLTNHSKTMELIQEGNELFDLRFDDISEIEAEISTLDNLLGLYHLYAGDLNEALGYFILALNRRKRIGQQHMIAISQNNVGVCYFRKGELEKSIEYFEQSENRFLELCNEVDIGLPFSNLALVYYDLGKPEKALDYFNKSVIIEDKLGNPINIAETYFGLTRTHLKLNDEKKSYEHVVKLKELDNKHDYKIITQWYKLSNAIYLINKPRINQKIIAQTLLVEIVNDQILHQRLTIIAMKELCKFYIMELKLFGSEEALGDAIELVNHLYDMAQDQLSFSLLVEVLILNAKLSLIQSDYQGAILFLDQAEFTSYEKGLIGLEMQVKMEKVALESETERWRQLAVKNASLKEKIEQSRIFEYLKDIRRVVEEY